MKRLVIFVLAFCSSTWATGWAAPKKAGSYPITVHVAAAHWFTGPVGSGWASPDWIMQLDVVINGKKYELRSELRKDTPTLLTPGDYQAALINDVHNPNNEFSQTYQLLLPDGSQQDFSVVGVSE